MRRIFIMRLSPETRELNPEFQFGCMLIYPLSYACTCKPTDQILARKRLRTYYFGSVHVRDRYTDNCWTKMNRIHCQDKAGQALP